MESAKEEVNKQKVTRRLFRYAMLYKARIIVALLLLVAAVGTQLAGPYIAKEIIDDHLLAIERTWYEADRGQLAPGIRSVEYGGKAYVREDWTDKGTAAAAGWKMAAIRQDGASLTIEGGSVSGKVRLSADEVLDFYKHDIQPIIGLLGLFLGLLVLSGILTFVQSYMLQTTALTIIQKMRMDVMTHIHRISVRYFDNTPVGQVVSRIANDTEAIRDLFMSFMATFVVSGVNLLGIFVAIFILDFKLAMLCLLLIPFFILVMAIHLKYSKVYVAAMRARLSDMNAMLNESINVMPMIQAFRREKARLSEFEVLNEDRYVNQRKQMRLFSLSSRNIVGLTGSLMTASVIWYFGGKSLETAISFGVFYAFIDYLGRIFQPIIGIFDQLTNAQRAFVSAERVFSLLDREGLPIEEEASPPRPQGNVKFDGVSFAYNGDDYVLKNITLEARKGETIALVGHTGSGKSSILNLLLGFYEPTKGTITIDGQDITRMSKQALRKHMGIVLQDPFLFTGDIKFNVALHEERIDLEQVKKALREVGASSFVEQLPKGYAEPVVERGNTLSAGQRQLISFARALAYNPAILILDEATASIDSETEGIIQDALQVLREGRTTFVIAHRLSTIKDADRILVLHRGEIVESGNHEQLMALQGRYFKMYQLQKGEAANPAGSRT
ncbi:ABC transporter ATP-binding protein [Paenibacillus mesophilus]|uniref:ABC transporter ATP-binding protein n=1 Tax=Paenibacillus mesophilus TaxID=2582849 RepID=UPI00110D7AEB|nr:ABC transporter ATP-binding protein [Paenibacillus mesophilus]TMV45957.1 ABC transporter ATP-binding protein [Paenibacillus mesophilus]